MLAPGVPIPFTRYPKKKTKLADYEGYKIFMD